MVRRRGSLAQQAYDRLKQDIVACRLRPGASIVESDLAATYGMSKTPIREAIGLLQREGYVRVQPRRGTFVAPIDVQDVQHAFMVRMLIEPEVAALAATRATGEQLRRLTELAEAGHAVGDPRERLRSNRQFHIALAEAAGIPRLVDLCTQLHEEVERFYNSQRISTGTHPVDHHAPLLQAVVSGDAPAARSHAADNIRASRRRLIEALIDEPSLPTLSVLEESA